MTGSSSGFRLHLPNPEPPKPEPPNPEPNIEHERGTMNEEPGTLPHIAVVAAVIAGDAGFFVTRRQQGVHLEGYWEFPGGKIDAGETHDAALKREIREELGADVEVGALLLTTSHAYPERTVTLYFYRCTLAGTPQPLLGQEMRWVPASGLSALAFPPADEELINLLIAETAAP